MSPNRFFFYYPPLSKLGNCNKERHKKICLSSMESQGPSSILTLADTKTPYERRAGLEKTAIEKNRELRLVPNNQTKLRHIQEH
jgi:hypothetical protein